MTVIIRRTAVEALRRQGLSVAEVARRSGCSTATMYRFLHKQPGYEADEYTCTTKKRRKGKGKPRKPKPQSPTDAGDIRAAAGLLLEAIKRDSSVHSVQVSADGAVVFERRTVVRDGFNL